ncbi:MAG TPA: ubiquitin-like domain-containing protein, partial [Bacteroidales bacterium]|nr:ubiquitin-like domain-containing protein [Bacteroidales bacterium]
MDILKKYGIYLIGASVILVFILLTVLGGRSSIQVNIWVDEQPEPISLLVSSSIPTKILEQAGVKFSEGDRFLVNGLQVAMDNPIENPDMALIQVRHAHTIELNVDGQSMTFSSSAQNLGEALWENNIILNASDILIPPVDTPMDRDIKAALQRSQVLYIVENGITTQILSSATTVGQALASAGYSLQNQDYCLPGENEPLPTDRTIKIVHVREEIQIQSTLIPFDTEFVADPQMDLDTKKMVQVGESGIRM